MSQFSNTYFCIMKTKNIEQYFKTFIVDNKLNSSEVKFLLAVSGGVDSIVLLSLFIKSKLNFSVCSCDFGLRGNEAKEDVKLVKKICSDKNIKFFSKVFDTKKYSKSNKISIQMASRDLRYNWFNKIIKDNSINYLVTAHHSDDSYETIIFNLLKTTGYKGLIGIPHLKNKIIRPLINVEKKDIIDYAKNNKLTWREDKTNKENKYSRNMIRNKLIPIISEINPSFKKSVLESSKRMELVNNFIKRQLERFIDKYVKEDKNFIEVEKSFIDEIENFEIILFDYLSRFGFNYRQINLFVKTLKTNLNKRFFSERYTLINDRKSFFLLSDSPEKINSIIINEIKNFKFNSLKFSVEKYSVNRFKLNKRKSSAQLDFDKIKFPLEVRNYKTGERFVPLGMKGSKKISNYLSDKKVSLIQKMNQLVIVDSDQNIIWLVSHQINENFKVDKMTENVLEFEIF